MLFEDPALESRRSRAAGSHAGRESRCKERVLAPRRRLRQHLRGRGRQGAPVNPFEFAFSLFGLLLGLALAEGLGGLARALKARHRVRIGWLTALLGLFVSLDLVTFWAYAWALREQIPATFPVLFYGFVMTALYFIAAACVFPNDPDEWQDLDGHFFRNRRLVLGGTFVANAMLLLAAITLLGGGGPWTTFRTLVVTWSMFPLTLVAMFARDRRVILAILAWLIALYPLSLLWR